MATTFTNLDKSSAPTFANASRNSATFSNASKSLRTFGSLTFDEIGAYTFDGMFQGKVLGDWAFDDLLNSDFWTNQNKS